MEERPAPYSVFSRHEMTVEAFAGEKETVHIAHGAVDHIAGAMSLWEVVGDGIEIGVFTELENSI